MTIRMPWPEPDYHLLLVQKELGVVRKPLASIARQVILDNSGEVPANEMGESLVESIRLVPRRCFSLVVDDEIVPVAIKTIIEVNQNR